MSRLGIKSRAPKPDPTRPGHRIAEISYANDRGVCSCGESFTAAGGIGWADHRRGLGLNVVTVGQSIGKRLGPR